MRQWSFLLFPLLLALACLPASAAVIDQTCPGNTTWGGHFQILSQSPVGQQFVPSISGHEGVAVFLSDMNDQFPAVPVTVSIHEDDIYGPVVTGSVVVRDVPPGGWEDPWTEFIFDEIVYLVPGELYVIEVATENARWGVRRTGEECYAPGNAIREGVVEEEDLRFRTLCNPSPSSITSRIYCNPTAGYAPFTSFFSVTISHDHPGQTRRIAARIDITLGNGQFASNWRAGYTNVLYGTPKVVNWSLTLPAIFPVLGVNLFEITAEDVTPAPYNQPPYAPSGDTDTGFTEIYIYNDRN